jgi:hypothetical protein
MDDKPDPLRLRRKRITPEKLKWNSIAAICLALYFFISYPTADIWWIGFRSLWLLAGVIGLIVAYKRKGKQ